MVNLRNINPMVRAVGTMGAVAAVVGGVTFASLTSNTVALSPNTMTTATASLAIGAADTCPTGDTSTTTGFTSATPLVPGGSPVTVDFCLDNKSNVPLLVTASIPTLPTGTAASDTTLSISCTTEGDLTANTQTLNSFAATPFAVALPANAQDTCTASASLSTGYSGTGGETIPAFDIDFIGNQTTTTT
ncbi:MAG TPA: hypothetical protein VMB52_06500 [Verrucomicrobiae bacterium]|nr:hypothetical protein [Verrucomicrobiae bacterium]